MIERANLDRSRIALFSECGAYRYTLLIRWNDSKPRVANIGLNPSTADEFKNDATITRDITRAEALGYGSLLKVNLFAFRSKDPDEMKRAPDPYGEWKDPACILAYTASAQIVIAAWGNHGTHLSRADMFRNTCAQYGVRLQKYELNKSGEPVHPLYKPYSLQPTPYEWGAKAA